MCTCSYTVQFTHVQYIFHTVLHCFTQFFLLPYFHKWISTHIALHLHGSSSCIPQLVYTDCIFYIADITYLKANNISLFYSVNSLGLTPSTCTSCSSLFCPLKYSITCVWLRTLRTGAFCGCDFWCNTWPWHNERKSVYPSSWSTQSDETCFLKVRSKSF